MAQIQKLTKAEEEIMQMIWQLEPTTVSNIIEQLPEPKPPHSSISSIVRLLEKKGFVDHTAYGRSYAYHSIVDKQAYSKFSLKGLVSKYFEGSMNNLVSFLVKEEDISLEQIEELQKKINSQD